MPPPPPTAGTDEASVLESAGAGEKESSASAGGLGIGLGGLGGYVGLGGKTAGPVGVSTSNGEVLLAREGASVGDTYLT